MFAKASSPLISHQFGVDVVLARGALVTASFTARRSDRQHSAMGQEYGLEVTVEMRDFLLPVASVVLDGDVVKPRTGDRITEGDEVFEIQPPDSRKASVQPMPGGDDWLVHTKRIE